MIPCTWNDMIPSDIFSCAEIMKDKWIRRFAEGLEKREIIESMQIKGFAKGKEKHHRKNA